MILRCKVASSYDESRKKPCAADWAERDLSRWRRVDTIFLRQTKPVASGGSQFVFRIEDLRSGAGKTPRGKKP
jgi:hypothetical protein